ncbi:MAG TPA: MBL fold metallo-hydrolase RNA specificity domain-containing protein [Candidatus Saccharimonadales bacterium]|nr:MBL fold metallo-hydrolase RNA specificity domain-containing protein [Candidatus Saccharimonadales bacterium]
MDLKFLGAAMTVTGSQYLLTTRRARILIDCGIFQGSPQETIRNRIPIPYDPSRVDAMLLTHAHLDHCGMIPHVVKAGFTGPIYATAGTIELAALVLLDSGKLQEEFNKREMRWERRHPDRAAQEDRQELANYETALDVAEAGEALRASPALQPPGSLATGEHVPTSIEPNGGHPAAPTASPATVATSAAARATQPTSAAARATQPSSAAARATQPTTAAARVTQPSSAAARASAAATAPAPAGTVPTAPSSGMATQDELGLDLDAPLYNENDARRSLVQFKPIRYDTEFEVAPGINATYFDAGHILGSAIIRLRVADDAGGPERILVFSGDLGRPGAPILRDYTAVTEADYLLIESTYGGREHQPEAESLRVLADTVKLVAEHDGVLLVPSFAIGRTQELVYQLDRLIDQGAIPLLPLYLDSPMATRATNIYRRHPEYYDPEAVRLQAAGETPLDYPKQIVTVDFKQSQLITRAPRPYMIVASNGMLTGGRVVGHLRDLIDDPNAVLLFVGYQGVGTLGAHLQAGATTVKIEGQVRTVRCQIRSITGFSAHADESELLDWIRNFSTGRQPGDPGVPKKVFIVHGDPEAQLAIEPKIQALGFDTVIPEWHQQVTLA